MKVVGIICEYNPFHHGHLYHIQQVKQMFPESVLVLVLNGYFLERGEISLISKEDKTKIALNHGVDIVLELPVVFGTQAADIFAEKSLELLFHLGVSDVVFGSESGNTSLLYQMAKSQLNPEFSSRVKLLLDSGVNYPTALSQAMNLDFILKTPNDLLGISYAKAVLKHDYPIQLHAILRTSDYHDTCSINSIVSASNIREKLKKKNDITPYVPSDVPDLLKTISETFLFQLLSYRIRTDNHLEIYETVDEGIENRLKKAIEETANLEEFIQFVKTKRYTYNRIRRMLIHILLGFTKEINSQLSLDYIHILGFTMKGQKYLQDYQDNIKIPTKPISSSPIYEFEKRAAFLYDLFTNSSAQIFEKRNKPVIKQ